MPLNCLFIAEPGWGKSYLAKCLAEKNKCEYLNYSIAQMASTRDLIEAFRVVVSTQKRTDKRILIFIDEIDAQLEGDSAFRLFLSPMWDGDFKIEGHTNRIDPCIWIFASTKPVSHLTTLSKGRDFISRINGSIIDLDFLNEDTRTEVGKVKEEDRLAILAQLATTNSKFRTEIVYHASYLLNGLFGPITHIDEDVLRLFYNIMPINGIRSLKIFISKFNPIIKGKVKKINVPILKFSNETNLKNKIVTPGLAEHIFLLDVGFYKDRFDARLKENTCDEIKILFNPKM